MKYKRGKRIIKILDGIVSDTVLFIFLVLLAIGCYAQWDTNQIFREAGVSRYATYKPTDNESLSFEQLREINPEVFGWLTVYGTNIDYPLLQSDNNDKYVTTDVWGDYALSGALFLDYRNSSSFTDFNSIIYGHHMAESAMFGDIEKFGDKTFFSSHQYGNLYYDGRDYGLVLFAFIETDAYDSQLYTAALPPESRQKYLEDLLTAAKFTRDIEATVDDHIVLLSACSDLFTNGRHVLVGMITDQTYEDTFAEQTGSGTQNALSQYSLWIISVLIMVLLLIIFIAKQKKTRKKQKGGSHENK